MITNTQKLPLKLKLQHSNKATKRFNTQPDQFTKPISKLNVKRTDRISSKNKFLDVYQLPNYREKQRQKQSFKKQQNQSRKTTFKLHSYKPSNGIKHLRTQTNQYWPEPTSSSTKKQSLTGFDKYQVAGTAGKGTFGVVYFGYIKVTGQKIAIKKVLQDKRYKNRQLQILKMIHHPNILEMKDNFTTYEGDKQYLNVVMDYYPDNLYQSIKKKEVDSTFLKTYIYQMLKGLDYLASLSIAHRDIKPHNILVNRAKKKVVICDFGSAKQLIKGQTNLAYICSRCYRAPELIFGATDYDAQIDMWSLGCVIIQMINGTPPFIGDSQLDQLFEIIRILGTPTRQQVFQMNKQYDIKQLNKFPILKHVSWNKCLKTSDEKLIDLIEKIMVYSPKKRLTPAQALGHTYFDDFLEENSLKQTKTRLKTDSKIVHNVKAVAHSVQDEKKNLEDNDNIFLGFSTKLNSHIKEDRHVHTQQSGSYKQNSKNYYNTIYNAKKYLKQKQYQ